MRDPRFKILEQLNTLLDGLNTDVHSVIPSNSDKPFIYIGDIQLQEAPLKSTFLYSGIVTVELYSGSQAWVGSIAPILTELDNIKSALRPTKDFVLDLSPSFDMSYWKLSSDTGLIQYSTTERIFVATLQFSFEITDLGEEHTDEIVHYGEPVEHSGEPVIHL